MDKRKTKICAAKECSRIFYQFSSLSKVCSTACGFRFVAEQDAKKHKAETRKMRREFNLKDKSYQTKKAQESFNAFIRERDKYQPCVSCGRYHQGQMQCGHYQTTGAHPELRFEPLNCASQCAPCNNHLSGNLIGYRKGLLDRIGVEKLEWLEGPHEAKNYTLDQIIEIKNLYRAKLKQLQQDRAA